jgi:hypothetical protein
MANKFYFSIPLKPQDKPVSFGDGFEKQYENEYAVRYLETIGVAPTPETLKMVHKNLPISKCRVTAAWKSRGWHADNLYITPHIRPSAKEEPYFVAQVYQFNSFRSDHLQLTMMMIKRLLRL